MGKSTYVIDSTDGTECTLAKKLSMAAEGQSAKILAFAA
jgi:hypothetical protein